jgi:hypothetical protein
MWKLCAEQWHPAWGNRPQQCTPGTEEEEVGRGEGEGEEETEAKGELGGGGT